MITSRNSSQFVLAMLWAACCVRSTAVGQSTSGAEYVPAVVRLECPQLAAPLAARISATWRQRKLRDLLRRLETDTGVRIWLDRRVDPQQVVDMSVQDLPLKEVFGRLAVQSNCGAACIANVAYLGPAESALQLEGLERNVQDQLERLPTRARTRWQQQAVADWKQLSEPRHLLEELARKAGCRVVNPEVLPHDLMLENNFPALQLSEVMTLLLLGFDMTFEISTEGSRCKLIPIPREVTYTNRYALPPSALRGWRTARSVFKDAIVAESSRNVTITGTPAEHYRLQKLLEDSSQTKRSVQASEQPTQKQRFSLKLKQQPVGAVLQQLTRQLGLELRWNAELLEMEPTVTEKLASCDVKMVELDELLAALLEPLQLHAEQIGDALEIRPAGESTAPKE